MTGCFVPRKDRLLRRSSSQGQIASSFLLAMTGCFVPRKDWLLRSSQGLVATYKRLIEYLEKRGKPKKIKMRAVYDKFYSQV
jgi:hypothetical protein